jgi:bacterioferritin (cytochrome b1)
MDVAKSPPVRDSVPLTSVSIRSLRVSHFYVGATLRRRIEEDLAYERHAINSLREMLPELAQDDPAARPRIEAILASEQERADELSDLLDGTRR